MHDSQLLKLFDSIQSNEWRALDKYLQSKFAENSELAQLYRHIKKHRKVPNSKKLNIEKANAILFKNKTRKNFSNLMSVLAAHIKSYFIHIQLNKKELLRNALLIEELNERTLYNEATAVYLDTEKKNDKWKIGLMNNLYKQMIYHQLYFSYNPVKNTQIGTSLFSKNIANSELSKTYFDALHHLETLARKIYKRENHLTQNINSRKEESIPDLIKSLGALQINQSKEEYEKVIQVFYNEFDLWDEELQNLTFHILRHYLSMGIIHGTNEIEELSTFAKFSIFDNGFDYKGLYSIRGAISLYETAVMSRKYDWADFIFNKVKTSNSAKEDGNELKILRAILYFSKEDYESSLLILNELSMLSRMEKIIIRKWQMMCYAEIHSEDYSFLQSQYINYNSFINRSNVLYSSLELEGAKTFGKVWKFLFLDKDVTAAKKLLDEKTPCPKRYFFQRKIAEANF